MHTPTAPTVSRRSRAGKERIMAEKSRPSGSIEVRAQLPRLEEVLEEMDRLWESVLSLRRRPLRALAREHVFPAIDVYEAEGALHVRVELPGMRAEDVEITAGERSLTISGVKPSEAEAEKASFLRSERSRG